MLAIISSRNVSIQLLTLYQSYKSSLLVGLQLWHANVYTKNNNAITVQVVSPNVSLPIQNTGLHANAGCIEHDIEDIFNTIISLISFKRGALRRCVKSSILDCRMT